MIVFWAQYGVSLFPLNRPYKRKFARLYLGRVWLYRPETSHASFCSHCLLAEKKLQQSKRVTLASRNTLRSIYGCTYITIGYTCEWNNLLCEADRIYICNVCYILHSKLQEAGDYNFYTSLHAISRFCSPNLKVIFVGALSKETNIGVSGNIASGNIISDNGMFIH